MRLATLDGEGGPRAVAITADGAAPIDAYADVGDLLRAGPQGWEQAHAAAAGGKPRPFDEGRLLRPVLYPGAVVCVGLNYRTHILEMGRELPTGPTLFGKLERALTDPFADIELPAAQPTVRLRGRAGGGHRPFGPRHHTCGRAFACRGPYRSERRHGA